MAGSVCDARWRQGIWAILSKLIRGGRIIVGAVTKRWLRLGGCGLMWFALAGVVSAQETEPDAEEPVQTPAEEPTEVAPPKHVDIEPRQSRAQALRQQIPEVQQRVLADFQGEFIALYQP